MVNDLEVYGASNNQRVLEFMEGKPTLRPTVIDTRKEFYDRQQLFDCDFSDVRGQENVKRAMEVASSGGHNLDHGRSSRKWQVDVGETVSPRSCPLLPCMSPWKQLKSIP